MYSSAQTVRVIKSRRMRWAGHVARMEDRRGAYRVLVGKPERLRPFGRPSLRLEHNVKMIFKKWGGEAWTGLLRFRIGTDGRRL
jgi:hypothetical protein